MLEVWGRRNASNVLPVMWAIGELALPHVRHDVGGSFGGLQTPAYLAMNPNGRIPTIRDQGQVVWESNAIVRHLARRYGQGGLLPDGDQGYSTADQWMDWHKTTPYPPYIELFWAIVRTEPAYRRPGRIARLAETVGRALGVLEDHLAARPYLLGERLTMADIPFGPMIHRYLALEVERPDLPHIRAWHERLSERPAFREHVMFPFGSTPAEWYVLERDGTVTVTEACSRNT
jgi:glutathione S-transferase